MLDRRSAIRLLAAVAAGAVAPATFAQSAPVDVVKVMSFSCSFCLAAEVQDRAIEEAVRAQGGRFVRAPIPESADAPGYRERVYYAARDLEPRFGETVKASLYKGTQDAQVALESYAQLYYWLLQDIPNEEPRLARLFELAQAHPAASALQRAIALTVNAGVERLPTYVLLSAGRVTSTLDTATTGAKSMAGLREAVIAKLQSN